jgi:hypothetical protein
MKNIFKIFTITIAAALMFTSCAEDAIDQLSGKYPLPNDYALSNLLLQDIQKNANTRTITLAIGSNGLSATDNGTGNYLYLEFLVARTSYLLDGGTYTVAHDTVAKAGNYIMGNDTIGSYWAEVAGGAEVKRLKVKDGTVYVSKSDDNYTISGTLFLEDRSMITVNYAGTILFEPDPAVYTYTLEIDKPYAWTADGMTWNPVAGSQLNKFTVFADAVKVAYFEIVTAEDITSYSGSYPVSGEIRDANGAVVQGLYIDLTQYGMGIIEGGSYLFDSENQYINAGNIAIDDNGGILTFTSSNLLILNKATGTPKPDAQSINYNDATNVTQQASYTYTIETSAPAMGGMMGTDPIAGSQMNKISVFSGSDLIAYFEVVSAENPAALTGEYVVTDGLSAIGQAANGYQLPAGWGGLFGGCYYIDNGKKMFIRNGGGNISITDNSGTLTITGSNLPILDVEAVETSGGTNWPNLPDPGSVNYQNVTLMVSATQLTNLLSASALDNSMFGGTGYTVTLKIGEAGVTATPGAFGVTIGGTGKYISVDFSRDAPTLPAGTYNIVDNASATAGDAIAGYDSGFGMYFGSVWGTAVSDATTEEPILAGGTVDVAESGGVYIITVNATAESGEVVKAVYTGAITIQ